MEWLGNSELHFVLVVLGVATIGLGGYAYYYAGSHDQNWLSYC